MGRKLFSFRLDEDGIEQLKKEADRAGISLTELVSRRLFSESKTNLDRKTNKPIDQNIQKNLEQSEHEVTTSLSERNTDSQLSDLILQLIIDKSSVKTVTKIPELIQAIDRLVVINEKQQKQINNIESQIAEIKKNLI